MKTLLFCTSYIPDESAWQQRYLRWLAHHRGSALQADAIVMIDDHSPYQPPALAQLPASRIGQDALAAEAMLRFDERLGRPRTMDFPGWYRGMFASVSLAMHYGFERIIHVESDSFILTQRLSEYLASRISGWTVLWCPEFNCPESAIQVLCRDAFHLVEQLAAKGPFAFRDQPAELTLPFTTIEKDFIGDRYHEFKRQVPDDADYAVQNHAAPPSKRNTTTFSPVLSESIAPQELPHASAHQLASSSSQQQLQDLVAAFPYDPEVFCRYGISAYQGNSFQVARTALERADWLRPEHGLTCKFLGAARMQLGELAGAISAAAQSARHNSTDVDAQNMAGAFNLQAGNQIEAIGYFRAALALEPEATSALSNLGLVKWSEPPVREQFPLGLRGIELEVRAALLKRLRDNQLTARGAAALMAFGVHFQEGFDLLMQLARAVIVDPHSDAQMC
jgi:tetratricopeptide (TPR) repeat protein